eukprot:11789086-Karenia_brevis.AAC.1
MARSTERRIESRMKMREGDDKFRIKLMSDHSGSRRCGCDEDQGDEKWIQPVTVDGDSNRMRLSFQVAAVSKRPLAVQRIVEKDNHV